MMAKKPRKKWTLYDNRNGPKVECWYAYGVGLEIEWSPIFRGIYFKILCIGTHIGYWKN